MQDKRKRALERTKRKEGHVNNTHPRAEMVPRKAPEKVEQNRSVHTPRRESTDVAPYVNTFSKGKMRTYPNPPRRMRQDDKRAGMAMDVDVFIDDSPSPRSSPLLEKGQRNVQGMSKARFPDTSLNDPGKLFDKDVEVANGSHRHSVDTGVSEEGEVAAEDEELTVHQADSDGYDTEDAAEPEVQELESDGDGEEENVEDHEESEEGERGDSEEEEGLDEPQMSEGDDTPARSPSPPRRATRHTRHWDQEQGLRASVPAPAIREPTPPTLLPAASTSRPRGSLSKAASQPRRRGRNLGMTGYTYTQRGGYGADPSARKPYKPPTFVGERKLYTLADVYASGSTSRSVSVSSMSDVEGHEPDYTTPGTSVSSHTPQYTRHSKFGSTYDSKPSSSYNYDKWGS